MPTRAQYRRGFMCPYGRSRVQFACISVFRIYVIHYIKSTNTRDFTRVHTCIYASHTVWIWIIIILRSTYIRAKVIGNTFRFSTTAWNNKKKKSSSFFSPTNASVGAAVIPTARGSFDFECNAVRFPHFDGYLSKSVPNVYYAAYPFPAKMKSVFSSLRAVLK